MNANKPLPAFVQYFQRLLAVAMIVILLPVFSVQNQDDGAVLDKQAWKDLTKGQDYIEKSKPYSPGCTRSETVQQQSAGPESFLFILQILAYGVVIVILAVLIWYLISSNIIHIRFPRNSNTDRGAPDVFEESPEAIDDRAKLQEMLNGAIAGNRFHLAIRIRFILLLRLLDDRKLLQFKIDKTNRQYVHELVPAGLSRDFRRLVLVFERVWYGGRDVSSLEYEAVNHLFERFTKNIGIDEK